MFFTLRRLFMLCCCKISTRRTTGSQSTTPSRSTDVHGEIRAKYVRYGVLGERRVLRLRDFSKADMEQAYAQAKQIYFGDPFKYPTKIPVRPHTVDEARFWSKCERQTPEDKPDGSLSACESALQHFVCTAALQAIALMYFDGGDAPGAKEILATWTQDITSQGSQYERDHGLDSRNDSRSRGKPSRQDWVDRKVTVSEPGAVKQYLVVEVVSSHKSGTTFQLEDINTKETREIGGLSEDDFLRTTTLTTSSRYTNTSTTTFL
ncbi:hypothetical protein EWM64_g9566 [Hericium alpestre]|uniref:Uncharacterized protein n=1 Tax=Hericium alpestre TaxID=135208 RepID=A0A4Y9ZI99_9AGAM|nr:hypothetical protein EWM64_g9566 [Hericium alpestre]